VTIDSIGLNVHAVSRQGLSWVMRPIHRAGNLPRFRRIYFGLRGQSVIDAANRQQSEVLAVLRLLKPRKAVGYQKVRVGTNGDGGYVQIDDFAGICRAFSFGVSTNDDWDLAIANRGIPVEQFDYSVTQAPSRHPLLRFHQLMISSKNSPTTATLPDLVARHSESDESDLILKVDIEGAEWEVFDSASEMTLSKFSQIICEFHGLSRLRRPDFRARVRRVLEKLDRVFAPVHVHANNYGGLSILANIPVPRHLEISFANRLRYDFADCEETFPTPLDVPCAPFLNEIALGAFRF
jgi:hypothetical protein